MVLAEVSIDVAGGGRKFDVINPPLLAINDATGVESVQFLNTGLYPVGIYTAPTVEFSGISTFLGL